MQLPRQHRDADDAGDEAAGLEGDRAGNDVREVVRRRDDVRGDVHRERRDDDREHRDGDDEPALELADEHDRIPDRLAVDHGRALVITMPIAANTVIVVGSATI